MRFRTVSTAAIGAATAGVMVASSLSSAAVASLPSVAPYAQYASVATASAASAAGSFECTYQSWTLDYAPEMVAVAEDGQVRLEMSDFGGIEGPPAFVTVSRVAATVTASYGGQEVALSGEVSPETPAPLADGFPLPTLVADAPEGVNGGDLVVTGLSITMTAMGMENAIGCEMDAPVTLEVAPEPGSEPEPLPGVFSCTYQSWTLGYDPEMVAVAEGNQVRLEMSDFGGIEGPPAFVTVSRVAATVTASYGGQEVTLMGEVSPETPAPLADGFPLPTLITDAPPGVNGGEMVVTGLSITMTAMGMENAIACDMASPVTVQVAPDDDVDPDPDVKTDTEAAVETARFDRLARVLHVGAAVTAEGGSPRGQVRIEVERRGNQVRTAVVDLDENGVASRAFRGFRGFATGNVVVKVTYLGDDAYEGSWHSVDADKTLKSATTTTIDRASYHRGSRALHVHGQVATEAHPATSKARVIVKRRGTVVRSRVVEIDSSGRTAWSFRNFHGFKKGRVRVVIRYTGDPANKVSRDAVAADKKG